MKVYLLNHSDNNGGAARAAYRIHHALRELDLDSQMLVNQALAGDWTVEGFSGRMAKASAVIRPQLGALITLSLRSSNPVLHSPAVLPSRWPTLINKSDADLVHLHCSHRVGQS